MARITRFFPVTKDRAARHTDVECGYAIVDYQGTPSLLLETYGSDERATAKKTSQSLLIDPDAARELRQLLNKI